MIKRDACESVNNLEKRFKSELMHQIELIEPMSRIEETYMNLDGSIFNPYGLPFQEPWETGFALPGSITDNLQLRPSWKTFRPELPVTSNDEWEDTLKEFQLIDNLNRQGNIVARRKFNDVQRLLYPKMNDREREMFNLADFRANENYKWITKPGMDVAMSILRECWPRWFGGKASVLLT